MSYPSQKQVCQLDENGFYLHTTFADLSPLEAEQGVYLLPANCVDIEPPEEKEGFLPKCEKGKWLYIADNRGTYYRTDTGEQVEHMELGELPKNLTALPPLDVPCKWDGKAWVVDTAKQAEIKAGTLSQLIDSIDNKATTIYTTWTRFESEYKSRQAAAEAFKAANYQGEPSIYITSFATAAGIDNQTATEIILQQAAGLQKLQDHLAALRMRKYELKRPDLTFEQMQSVHDDIISQMDALMEAYQNG